MNIYLFVIGALPSLMNMYMQVYMPCFEYENRFNVYMFLPWMWYDDMCGRCMLGLIWIVMIDICYGFGLKYHVNW